MRQLLAGCAIVAWPVCLVRPPTPLLFLPRCLTGRFDPDIYLNRAVPRTRVGKGSGPWCSGSAVQLRHYPVTVSAESKAGPAAAGSHWTVSVWEGTPSSMDA